MCYRVLVAANEKLPVEDAHNDDAFQVRQLSDAEIRMIPYVHQPYVYEVLSWQGCGCGFHYEDKQRLQESLRDLPPDDLSLEIDAWENGRKSVRRLGDWLRRCTAIIPVDLYACWIGKELEMPQHPRSVPAGYFDANSFTFRKTEWLQIYTSRTGRLRELEALNPGGPHGD